MLPTRTSTLSTTPATALAAKVAWIDRYRLRLTQALPGLAPIDAALLAVDAHALQARCGGLCPDDSAARFAAAHAALCG